MPVSFEILPAKASTTKRGRRLVYLDQNVLSDLARHRLGRVKASPRTEALEEFEDALKVSVLERGASVPEGNIMTLKLYLCISNCSSHFLNRSAS